MSTKTEEPRTEDAAEDSGVFVSEMEPFGEITIKFATSKGCAGDGEFMARYDEFENMGFEIESRILYMEPKIALEGWEIEVER